MTLTDYGNNEIDERVIAQAALEAANEQLQSLCAAHAGTFVGVERRWKTTYQGLRLLLVSIRSAHERVKVVADALDNPSNSNSNAAADDDHEEKEEEEEENDDSNGVHRSVATLSSLSEQHRVRRRTLLQHSSLLELLELPNLMDACVRSNLYEEALSIAAFANTLERRHGCSNNSNSRSSSSSNNSNPVVVVSRVIRQIRARQGDLRRQLIRRLQSSVNMPACLEIVTALRRLNSIDLEQCHNHSKSHHNSQSSSQQLEKIHAAMELQLQVEFIEARDAWLDSTSLSSADSSSAFAYGPAALSSSSSSSSFAKGKSSSSSVRAPLGPMQPTEQLLDAIERYRTRVFEVATQFNAIFCAQQQQHQPFLTGEGAGSDGITTTASSLSSLSSLSTLATSIPLNLLSMWLSRRVHVFLTHLQSQLLFIEDSANLRDALDACVFFGSSMGRLGGDFTAQLLVLFEPRMLALVTKCWNDGSLQLIDTLSTCRQATVNFPLVAATISSSNAETDTTIASVVATNTTTTNTSTTDHGSINKDEEYDDDSVPPPRQLLAYPPLARFVNAILSGLNELRRCLLPGIFSSLLRALQDTLLPRTRIELVAHERAVLVPGFKGEAAALRSTARQYLDVYDRVICPYVTASLHAALGQTAAAGAYYRILKENTATTTDDALKPTIVDGGTAVSSTTINTSSPTIEEEEETSPILPVVGDEEALTASDSELLDISQVMDDNSAKNIAVESSTVVHAETTVGADVNQDV